MKLVLAAAFALLASSLPAQQPALDPDAAGPADRIWCADVQEQQVWFRRQFSLPETVTTARLIFTCDNEAVAFVNGAEVARSDDWEEVTVVDLEGLGRDNVIAIAANNTGGPGALACWILWTDAAGEPHQVVTDPQWRVATTLAAGWETAGFDDRAWVPATANFTSTFGLNLYNGNPRRVRFHNRFAAAADAIEAALQGLRTARDADTARKALDVIERAVMTARRQVWANAAEQPDRKR